MLKRLVKPYAIALYLLAIPVFFVAGVLYTKFTGSAEGQGLAAGAIIVGNGLIFSTLAFIASLFVVSFLSRRIVLLINTVLLAILILMILYVGLKYVRITRQVSGQQHTFVTATSALDNNIDLDNNEIEANHTPENVGLGFFKPDFFSQPVLYFYGNPNFEKSVSEHCPIDSIVFERQEYGGIDIIYAPPWLYPHHLKLDYDILYFSILTFGREFLEVTVNTLNQKTMYVDRFQGDVIFWPEFLLGVATINFPKGNEQVFKFKPNENASDVVVLDSYRFMKPMLVQGDWIRVQLQDQNLKNISIGWIRWQHDGKLLIRYTLLC